MGLLHTGPMKANKNIKTISIENQNASLDSMQTFLVVWKDIFIQEEIPEWNISPVFIIFSEPWLFSQGSHSTDVFNCFYGNLFIKNIWRFVLELLNIQIKQMYSMSAKVFFIFF